MFVKTISHPAADATAYQVRTRRAATRLAAACALRLAASRAYQANTPEVGTAMDFTFRGEPFTIVCENATTNEFGEPVHVIYVSR